MENIFDRTKDYTTKKEQITDLLSRIEELRQIENSWNSNLSKIAEWSKHIALEKNNFTAFDRLFKTKKYVKTFNHIKSMERDIADYNSEIQKFASQEGSLESLHNKIMELTKQKGELDGWVSTQEPMNGFSYDSQGFLHFVENDLDTSFFRKKREGTSLDMKETDSLDAYALVHCTSFFPYDNKILNNYDGKKPTFNRYRYPEFSMESYDYQQRITTHFTLNGKVGNNDGGTWDNADFMIIEPLSKHYDEVCNLFSGDSWVRASVELSDDAIIMVPSSLLSKLDFSRTTNKIIIYDGDPIKALDTVLYNLGYKPQLINGRTWNNAAHVTLPKTQKQTSQAHSESLDSDLERMLNTRNTALQLIRGNQEPFDPYVSQLELLELYDLIHSEAVARFGFPEFPLTILSTEVANRIEEDVYKEFLTFFLSIGLVIENNKFRLLNPYEMYDYISNENFNYDDLSRLAGIMVYMTENRPTKCVSPVSMNMAVSEIAQYQNLDALQEVNRSFSACYRNLGELCPSLIWSTKGLRLEFHLDAEKYDKTRFLKSDDIVEGLSRGKDIYNYTVKRTIATGDKSLAEAFQLLQQEVYELNESYGSISNDKPVLK